MTTQITHIRRLATCLVGLTLALGARTGRADGRQDARQILDAAGIKGGVIVHLGCGDGKLTAALRATDRYTVHGLATDEANVEKARQHIRSLGLYGNVSVDRLSTNRLPYVDNFVNLLVAQGLGGVPTHEVMRVLVPNGVACVKKTGQWTKTIKPRPKEIDEWTHYLHDSTNNAVAHDSVVGPPRRFQWIGSPRWSRHHDHMASMTALVSANGRIFYIMDEGSRWSIQLPAKWFLIARDAFNGVVLWKRPIPLWNTHRWPLKSGPAQLPRRVVAVGDTVYVTLGLDAPLSALDAATGETIRTYEGTKNTEEVIFSGGVLFVQLSEAPLKWLDYRHKESYVGANIRRGSNEWPWDRKARPIAAIRADTGEVLWKKECPVAHLTLTADAARVLFHDGERIVCLDRNNGAELWKSEPVSGASISVNFGATLVAYKDIVLFAGGNRKMTALSIKNGKTLWTAKHNRGGHHSPQDLLVIDDLAWSGQIAGGGDSGLFTGRDVRTGEARIEFTPDIKTYWFHHRCHRSKATDKYILASRTGIEFVDVRKKHWITHHWVRGGCLYGVMPCNGLVYAPPHSCGCYLEGKLCGFNALAPARRVEGRGARGEGGTARLERGAAFGAIGSRQSAIGNANDWPTYRHDPARSGHTRTSVPTDLRLTWQARLGGRLSSLTIADGKLFVATVDAHTVHALDANSGKPVWSCTVGGRVDSPPTIARGRVVFGSADGCVYCLRASDGELIWRFRGAPVDRRLMAYEQVESVWPVHGSVLVQSGVVHFVAGRSMFADGGLRLCRLDLRTGRKLSETIMDDRDPNTGKNLQVHVKGLTMPVALPDILSSDGKSLYMRSQQFDLEGKRRHIAQIPVSQQRGAGAHLFCEIGFLDDSWFHRSYWLYGRGVSGGYGGWFQAARLVPAGRILVFDDAHVYGYGRKPEYIVNASVLEYRLFAADKEVSAEALARVGRASGKMGLRSRRRNANSSDWKLRRHFPVEDLTAARFKWASDHPSVQARAMVLADKALFVAGPPDVMDERRAFRLPDDEEVGKKRQEQDAALLGKFGARLWAVSAADGKPLARYKLDTLPVWDGMAAAKGRLFLATMDGRVLCLGAKEGEALARADAEPVQVMSDEPAEPDYLEPPLVPKDQDFAFVRGCRVFASKLGYRLRARARKGAGIALKKLNKPLRRKAILKARMKALPGLYHVNGLLAFGDKPKADQLVKCGLRVAARSAAILQGPVTGGVSKAHKVAVEPGKTYELKVVVDLENQKVLLTVNDVTVEAPLTRRLDAITHVGYCVHGALTDFSPVEVEGE